MQFLAWTYDVAREQSPSAPRLIELGRRSQAAGYDALGLYLEHRFAYPSAPWAAGPGALTPATVRQVRRGLREAAGAAKPLRLIPFINVLGHMEGFVRAQGGQAFAEADMPYSLQICPSRRACVEFARGLVEDTLRAFDDEWVHLGGDETKRLGHCARCAARARRIGTAGIYAEHFAPLCKLVLKHGRRPCLWGDMLLAHPEALKKLPRETVIFNWQYFQRPRETTRRLRQHGFDVVCCPSLQTYNSGWCYLRESQRNIDQHAADARALGALGVCLTTWEFTYFSQYASVWPLIFAAGRRLSARVDWHHAIEHEGGRAYAEAAHILGDLLPRAAAFLKPGTWRQLRDRLVMRQNPFHLWREWRREACGPAGTAVLRWCERASARLPRAPELATPVLLHEVAIRFVRAVETAARNYAAGRLSATAKALGAARAELVRLALPLGRAAREGGSTVDPERHNRLVDHVETVRQRVRTLSVRRGTRPAFEVLVHERWLPGDQAAWFAAY